MVKPGRVRSRSIDLDGIIAAGCSAVASCIKENIVAETAGVDCLRSVKGIRSPVPAVAAPPI